MVTELMVTDLHKAAYQGNVEQVAALIPISDPKAVDSWALRIAAENGHTECVRLLIPVSDPKGVGSCALRLAAMNGHTDIVKLLIPVSDPKAELSAALRMAMICGQDDVLDLLWDISDVDAAFANLRTDQAKHAGKYALQRWEARMQQAVLQDHVGQTYGARAAARKM